MLSDGLTLKELLTDGVVKRLPPKEKRWFAQHPDCNETVCKDSALCRRFAAQRKFIINHLLTSEEVEEGLSNYLNLLLGLRILLCHENNWSR